MLVLTELTTDMLPSSVSPSSSSSIPLATLLPSSVCTPATRNGDEERGWSVIGVGDVTSGDTGRAAGFTGDALARRLGVRALLLDAAELDRWRVLLRLACACSAAEARALA